MLGGGGAPRAGAGYQVRARTPHAARSTRTFAATGARGSKTDVPATAIVMPASASARMLSGPPSRTATASAARAVPSADLRRQRRGLRGAPAGGLVLVHGRRRPENGLDDRPCRFDGVLPREERRVARH